MAGTGSAIGLTDLPNVDQTYSTEVAVNRNSEDSLAAVANIASETLTRVSDLLADIYNRTCSRTSLRWRIRVILELVKHEPIFYNNNGQVIEVEMDNERISVIDIVIGLRERDFVQCEQKHAESCGIEDLNDSMDSIRDTYVAILEELSKIYQDRRVLYLSKKYELKSVHVPIWNPFVEEQNEFIYSNITISHGKGMVHVKSTITYRHKLFISVNSS